MAKKKLDWPAIWKAFDVWCNKRAEKCTECSRFSEMPEWDEQQKKIQQLVDKALV